jgi:hypothetical protein
MKTITIKEVSPVGTSGKVNLVTYEVGGQTGKAKCWADRTPAIGATIETDFEKKPGLNGGEDEAWLKPAFKPKGGGGGGGFRGEPKDDASIAVQVILKLAAEAYIQARALDPKTDPGMIDELADRLAEVYGKTYRTIKQVHGK